MTTGPVRAAGRGRDDAGRLVLWSVAEGARGRRWREATLDGETLRLARSVTFETGPDRSPTRLEVTDGQGLLTLHPEPRGMFGNHVGSSGVRPISLVGVPTGARLLLDGSGLTAAALCWSLVPTLAVGDRIDIDVVRLGPGEAGTGEAFAIGRGGLSVQRIDDGLWRLVAPGPVPTEPVPPGFAPPGFVPQEVRIDADGLPLPDSGERWPLDEEGEDEDLGELAPPG